MVNITTPPGRPGLLAKLGCGLIVVSLLIFIILAGVWWYYFNKNGLPG